ncbi:unnamed protein product [Pedinophyceae sp. YPF-701]|nr:unnamed protein product [Pedinophyceae sp. YPF-701]
MATPFQLYLAALLQVRCACGPYYDSNFPDGLSDSTKRSLTELLTDQWAWGQDVLEPTYAEFSRIVSQRFEDSPDREAFASFLEDLRGAFWEAESSVDALVELASRTREVVEVAEEEIDVDWQVIDKHSALGTLAQRLLVAFQELSFESVCQLAVDAAAWARGAPATHMRFDPWLAEHVSRAQDTLHKDDERWRACADDLRRVRSGAAGDSATSAEVQGRPAHWLAALETEVQALALGRDAPGAEEALRRRHDYGLATATGRGQAVVGGHVPLLALASMHTALGLHGEARRCLSEAMTAAQREGRAGPLVHLLAALCHVAGEDEEGDQATQVPDDFRLLGGAAANEVPRGSARTTLLRQCLGQAETHTLPDVVAYARLAIAAETLIRGGPARPEAALVGTGIVLRRLGYACGVVAAYASAASPGASPLTSGSAGTALVRDEGEGDRVGAEASASCAALRTASGQSLLLEASAHREAACGAMAGAVLESFMRVHFASASAADRASATATLAMHVADTQGPSAGLRVLEVARQRSGNGADVDGDTRLRLAELMLLHTRALRAGQVLRAREALDALQEAVAAAPDALVPAHVRADVMLREAETRLAEGDAGRAQAAAKAAFAFCAGRRLRPSAALALVCLSRVYAAAERASVALECAAAARHHCETLGLRRTWAEAAMLSGQCDEALPLCLSSGDARLIGEARLQRAAQRLVSGPGGGVPSRDAMADVCSELEAACASFNDAEMPAQAAECARLMALTMAAREDRGGRDAWASKWEALRAGMAAAEA